MTATLTGKYIANTYKPLLQLKGNRPLAGSTNVTPDNYTNNILTDGEGRAIGGVTIEHNNSGGFYTRNITDPNTGAWRIQHRTLNGQEGLNFARILDDGNFNNGRLFVKNTGSVWLGFNDNEIVNDIVTTPISSNSSLYMKDGFSIKKANGDFITFHYPVLLSQSPLYIDGIQALIRVNVELSGFVSNSDSFNTSLTPINGSSSYEYFVYSYTLSDDFYFSGISINNENTSLSKSLLVRVTHRNGDSGNFSATIRLLGIRKGLI